MVSADLGSLSSQWLARAGPPTVEPDGRARCTPQQLSGVASSVVGWKPPFHAALMAADLSSVIQERARRTRGCHRSHGSALPVHCLEPSHRMLRQEGGQDSGGQQGGVLVNLHLESVSCLQFVLQKNPPMGIHSAPALTEPVWEAPRPSVALLLRFFSLCTCNSRIKNKDKVTATVILNALCFVHGLPVMRSAGLSRLCSQRARMSPPAGPAQH